MTDEPASKITVTIEKNQKGKVNVRARFEPPVKPGSPDPCKETVEVLDVMWNAYWDWEQAHGDLRRD